MSSYLSIFLLLSFHGHVVSAQRKNSLVGCFHCRDASTSENILGPKTIDILCCSDFIGGGGETKWE